MVRKLSDKGVTRTVTGSTGSSLCFMFCLLHSQQGSGPCFDEWFPCRQRDYSQYRLPPICGYRYLHMTFNPKCFCVEALCSPLRKVTMLVLFEYVICWHQYHVLLPTSFVCIWLHLYETKHCIQAQTSCCRARAWTSTVSFLGIFGVQQTPVKSPSACPSRGLADQGWNILQSDVLMLCSLSLQEASSSAYHESRQRVSVPRSSPQNTAKATRRGSLAL